MDARSAAANTLRETDSLVPSAGAETPSSNSFGVLQHEAVASHVADPARVADGRDPSHNTSSAPATPAGVTELSTQSHHSTGPTTPNPVPSEGQVDDVQSVFTALSSGSEHEIAFLVRHYAETLGPW